VGDVRLCLVRLGVIGVIGNTGSVFRTGDLLNKLNCGICRISDSGGGEIGVREAIGATDKLPEAKTVDDDEGMIGR